MTQRSYEPMYAGDDDPARGYEDRIVAAIERGIPPREYTTLERYRYWYKRRDKQSEHGPSEHVKRSGLPNTLDSQPIARKAKYAGSDSEDVVSTVDFDTESVRMPPPDEVASYADDDGCIDARRVVVFYHPRINVEYIECSSATNSRLWLADTESDGDNAGETENVIGNTVWVAKREEVKGLYIPPSSCWFFVFALIALILMTWSTVLTEIYPWAGWCVLAGMLCMTISLYEATRRMSTLRHRYHSWVHFGAREWKFVLDDMSSMVRRGYKVEEIERWLDQRIISNAA